MNINKKLICITLAIVVINNTKGSDRLNYSLGLACGVIICGCQYRINQLNTKENPDWQKYEEIKKLSDEKKKYSEIKYLEASL